MQNIFFSKKNALLNKFTIEEYVPLSRHLELVSLDLAEVLYEAGEEAPYIYFPIDSSVSLLHTMKSGASVEIAVIGSDGAVGIARNNQTMLNSAIAVVTGTVYRIKKNYFMEEIEHNQRLFELFIIHTQILLAQIAQLTLCSNFHTVEQQLCRWLLMNTRRLNSTDIPVTSYLVSYLLGIPLERISQAMDNLSRSGLIKCQIRSITILNRRSIEKRSCECFYVITHEIERLLKIPPSLQGIRHCEIDQH